MPIGTTPRSQRFPRRAPKEPAPEPGACRGAAALPVCTALAGRGRPTSGGTPTAYSNDKYGNMTSDAESVSSSTALTYDLADRTRAISGSTDTCSYAGPSETVPRIANRSGRTNTDTHRQPRERPARGEAGGDP